MGSPRIWIARRWRMPKIMITLFVLEFPLTVAALTLFGVAQPNSYRTKLWQNGSDQGFNSDPSEILYAYANYKPIATPLVWSQFLTDFNVAISVISMFALLTKVVVYTMHGLVPIASLLLHTALLVLYAVAVRNQSAPDLSDSQHPSPGMPWYLSKGCSFATPGNYSYCQQARASFAVSILLLSLFAAYLIYAVANLKPSQDEINKRQNEIEMSKLVYSRPGTMSKEEQRAYNRQLFLNLPKTPTTPFHNLKSPTTPRTRAFSKLTGGEPTSSVTVSNAGPSRKLPFREHYNAVD